MTIICLEGASGIGKSTAADFMERKYGYVRIPEVNELFERSYKEPSDWYFRMQVKRWELARDASLSGKVAILDGDHLQPVWYNWIFDDLNLQTVEEVLEFYSKAFSEGALGFPDAYVLLHLDIDELRSRKESDKRRSRRNFEMHLRLIEPQRDYFEMLQSCGHSSVAFMEATSPDDIADCCLDFLRSNFKKEADKPKFGVIEDFFRSKGALR